MGYLINFDTAVQPARLKQAILDRWDLDPAAIFAGTEAEIAPTGPGFDVMILSGQVPDSGFDTEFHAGEVLAEACGRLSELELTTILCRALGARAIIPDGGRSPDCWMLVTEDGWHGRVILDDPALDDGIITILHAYDPVPVAPEIPVQEPPYWQAGWYDDGVIPEAGYLDEV